MVSDIIRTSHQAKVWLAHGDSCEGCKALGPSELEAIVRDLAAIENPGDRDGECILCGVVLGMSDWHPANCAWVRSREWVSAHPVSGDRT